jgi:tetratricopeptide (TPR) repeat protein
MRGPWFFGAALAALTSLAGGPSARGQFLERHGQPARAASPVLQAAPSQNFGPAASVFSGSTSGHHHHGGGFSGDVFFFSGGYPWYAVGYYGPPWYSSSWYGPALAPANMLSGPQVLMGWNNPTPPAGAPPLEMKAPSPQERVKGVGGFGELADDEAKNGDRPKVRASNAEAISRARQFIAYGDQHFHVQEFSDAYQRYKKAAAAAPDLAAAPFRQGFSLMAMGRYAPAAKALKHGLALQPDWANSPFRVDDLYGDNRLAKATHLEQLATEATEQPRNADLMFLLGASLYFDGQGERARVFFERAAELGFDREAVAGFFKPESQAPEKPVHGREL